MGSLQRCAEPGLLDHPASSKERRASARSANLGAHPVLGEGEERWPQADQRKGRDRRVAAFRDAYGRRRCLLPIDNFFEWRAIKGVKTKQPYAIAIKSGEPFALAAIWENWKVPGTEEWLRTFCIITATANELVSDIHDRMPVIRAGELRSVAVADRARSARPAGALSERAHDDVADLYQGEQAGER